MAVFLAQMSATVGSMRPGVDRYGRRSDVPRAAATMRRYAATEQRDRRLVRTPGDDEPPRVHGSTKASR